MPAMGTKSREVIWGGRIGAAKINAEEARRRAKEAARAAEHAEAYAFAAHGGLRWACATVPNHLAMPQRRTGLARGRMQSLQDPREPFARRHPPAAGYADLEARSLIEVPVLSERSVRSASADDKTDRDTRD